jgi:hydrogenase/urease accessory protein HupE
VTRAWRCFALWALVSVGLALTSRSAHCHQLDSSSLTLLEVADGRFSVRWHPGSEALAEVLKQPVEFPKRCRLDGNNLDCGSAGLVGEIAFPWLKGSTTRVLVQIDWRSGTRTLRIVDGRSPSLTLYGGPSLSRWAAIKPVGIDYTRLGVEHILTGYDHLLFVLALTLLAKSPRRLVATITAFTVAHSLTLALTVLGWLSLPSAPVEACIALSIVLACSECLRASDSLAHRAPWLVAFAFGLLHGLGFASALIDVGLPERHLPTALVFFNVGVELGQLAVILLLGLAGWLLVRFEWRRAWMPRALVYAMGSLAAFWFIERGLALFVQ